MNNKRKFFASFSTEIFQENQEEPQPWSRAHYLFNSDGTNCISMSQPFTMKPVILKIPNGINIIDAVMQFAQRYQLTVTVLNGHGLISEVDFIAYPAAENPPGNFSDNYQMVSFTGTYSCLNAGSGEAVSCFNVSCVDGQGNIMGGLVASVMKAASDVTLALTISNDL